MAVSRLAKEEGIALMQLGVNVFTLTGSTCTPCAAATTDSHVGWLKRAFARVRTPVPAR